MKPIEEARKDRSLFNEIKRNDICEAKMAVFEFWLNGNSFPYYTQKDGFWIRAKIPIDCESLIKQFKDDDLEFSPGENWQYSDSNYFLLGHIIEKVSGKSYEEYLKDNFFVP